MLHILYHKYRCQLCMPYKFVIIVIRSVKISNSLANNLQTKANLNKKVSKISLDFSGVPQNIPGWLKETWTLGKHHPVTFIQLLDSLNDVNLKT